MTNQDYIEFIDEVLADFEDTLHSKEGENCTKARAYLDKIRQQLTLTDVSESFYCGVEERKENSKCEVQCGGCEWKEVKQKQ
jgi:hypothetical protein